MQIREFKAADLPQLDDIDATIESAQYLHVNVTGEGLGRGWSLEVRPMREKLIDANRLEDEVRFAFRQVAGGADEGMALAADHRGQLVAALLAQPDPRAQVLTILDVRVDYDHRRQGLGMAMIYKSISHATELGLRAVRAECRTNNDPASRLLARCGFELSGIDTLRLSNHDLVKESATLVWYLPLSP